jgi:hypothetical protein
MHSTVTAFTLGIVSALALVPQDKPKQLPRPPQDARPLPKVLEPARSPAERRDLVQVFRKRHPIEGFYRLRSMVVRGNRHVKGSRGYLVVGQRHLSMHLYAPATNRRANIQAVVRRYRIVANQLVMNGLLGHRNKSNGDIALEPTSFAAEHRFLLSGAVLRIHRAADEYLEFERIE